jgi:hypothetical protein
LIRRKDTRDNELDENAINLFLAAKKATEKGPVNRWEAAVVENIVTILGHYPVSDVAVMPSVAVTEKDT